MATKAVKTPADKAPKTNGRGNRAAAPVTPTHTFTDRIGMTVTYEEVETPTITRGSKTPAVNPHTSGVETAVAMKGNGRALSMTVFTDEVGKNERWLREAGNKLGVTVRTEKTDAGDGRTRITFWAVDKIARNRKSKTLESIAASPAPDAA